MVEADLENLFVVTVAVDDSLVTPATLDITQGSSLTSLTGDLGYEESQQDKELI